MNWFETQVQKMHDWDRAENLAFAKMAVIVFVVIIGLIVWAVIA